MGIFIHSICHNFKTTLSTLYFASHIVFSHCDKKVHLYRASIYCKMNKKGSVNVDIKRKS